MRYYNRKWGGGGNERETWGIGQERRYEFHLHTQEDQDFSATATATHLITDKISESRSVDLANNVMGNHYLRDVRPWFTMSYASQDHIFHIH
jgi:hypothetical protein